ncbi:hypothetical protein LSH36_107g12027 [Paralvinella palmiformis]|uniref:Uncharacterized protein n=1 Tax=Paralvinella palmiformis TaxID=53620 RepID=A0AAD9JZM4_9ANNE|nr:hypothetical protein LSH36_107g12027 [Paralvinella palmiformis]
MVERLKEQNDILELEKLHGTKIGGTGQTLVRPEFPHLQTENVALKEMVKRQREQLELLRSQNMELPDVMETGADVPAVQSKTPETTVINITSDSASPIAPKEAILNADPPHVQVLNAVTVMAAAPDKLKQENRLLRSELARLEEIHAQSSLIGIEDMTDLKKRNVALTEMVASLKERNNALEEQIINGQQQIVVPPLDNNELVALQEMVKKLKEENDILQTENSIQQTSSVSKEAEAREVIALREMVLRLREENEILQRDNLNQHPQSFMKMMADDTKIIGMQEIIKRLKEENELLQLQLMQEPVKSERSLSSASSVDELPEDISTIVVNVVETIPVQSAVGKSPDYNQLAALKEMVERLKEQNEILEAQIMESPRQHEEVQHTSVAGIDVSSVMLENDALKEMVERLREQNNVLEQETEQKVPITVVQQVNIDENEVMALREMVQRLKEQVELLEQDSNNHRSTDHVGEESTTIITESPDLDNRLKENIALKEMVIRLKDQNDEQEQQIISLSIRGVQDSPQVTDKSELIRENVVLKEMVQNLKQQNADILPGTDTKQKSVDADLLVENAALKEMVERLKEQMTILELELEVSKNTVAVSTILGDRGHDEERRNLKLENVSLHEMVERLKEQIDILQQYKDVGVPQVGDEVQIEEVRVQVSPVQLQAAPGSQIRANNNDLQEGSESSSDSDSELDADKHKRFQVHELANEIKELKNIVARQQVELDTCSKSNGMQTKDQNIDVLKAMLDSQREQIEILEAENKLQKSVRPLDVWSGDEEKVKMRAELERLKVQLTKAMKLNSTMDSKSDLDELRNMVNELNNRNRQLQEQIAKVTIMNNEIGTQMTINEQLCIENKALKAMISQMTGEMMANDGEQELVIEQKETAMVSAAPKLASDDSDILHLRQEKNASERSGKKSSRTT